jgi:hypothetical protein
MKYILVLIVSLGPLVRKCAQEGSELAAQRAGRTFARQGTKTFAQNADIALSRVTARSPMLIMRVLNNEKQFVRYIDSTNTFILDNVNARK